MDKTNKQTKINRYFNIFINMYIYNLIINHEYKRKL